MCFDVSIPIRLIWSTDGLPLSEINSNDLILAHSMPRGPSTPTTVLSPGREFCFDRFQELDAAAELRVNHVKKAGKSAGARRRAIQAHRALEEPAGRVAH